MAKVKQNMKAIDLNSSRSDKLNLSEVQSETPKAELVTIGTQTMSIVPEKPMTFDTCTQTIILKASEISTQTMQAKVCEMSMQTMGVLALEISTQTAGIKTDQVGIQTEKEKVQEIQTQTEGTKASEISTQTLQAKICEMSMQTEKLAGSEIATQTSVKTGQMSIQTENVTGRCTEIETQTEDFVVIVEKEQGVTQRKHEEIKAGSPILIWENNQEMNEDKDFKEMRREEEEESGEIVRELEPIKESSRSMDETDQISPIQMQDSQVSQGENGGNKRNQEESFEFMRDQKGLGDSIAFSEAIKEESEQEGAVEKMKEFLQRMMLMNGLKVLKEEAKNKANEEALKKLAGCIEKKMMKESFEMMKAVHEMKVVKSEAAEKIKGVIEGVLIKRFADMKDVERIDYDELKEGAVMKMKEVIEGKLMEVFAALKNGENKKSDHCNVASAKGNENSRRVDSTEKTQKSEIEVKKNALYAEEDTERVQALEEEAAEQLRKVNKSEKVKEAGVKDRRNNASEEGENFSKVEDTNVEEGSRKINEQEKNEAKSTITREQAKETQEEEMTSNVGGKLEGESKNVEDEITSINNRDQTQEKIDNSNPKEEQEHQRIKVEEKGKNNQETKEIQNQEEGDGKTENRVTNKTIEAEQVQEAKNMQNIERNPEGEDNNMEANKTQAENKTNNSDSNEETQEVKNSNIQEGQENQSMKVEEKGKSSQEVKTIQNIEAKTAEIGSVSNGIEATKEIQEQKDARRKEAAKNILKLFENKMKDIFGAFKNAIESQHAEKAFINTEASKIEEVSTAAIKETEGSLFQEEGQDSAKGGVKTTVLQDSGLTFGPDTSRNESALLENPHHQGQNEAKENSQVNDLNGKNSFRQPINQEESAVKDGNTGAPSTNLPIPSDNIVINGASNGQTPKTTAVPTMAGPHQSGANTPIEPKSQEKTIETPQRSNLKPEEERKSGEKSELPSVSEIKALKFSGKFALADFKITKPSELEQNPINSLNNNNKQEPSSSSSSSPAKKGGFDDAFKMFDMVCNGRNARQSPPRGTKQDEHNRYPDEQEALFKYKDSADSKSPTGRTRTPPKEIKTTRIINNPGPEEVRRRSNLTRSSVSKNVRSFSAQTRYLIPLPSPSRFVNQIKKMRIDNIPLSEDFHYTGQKRCRGNSVAVNREENL